MKDLIKLNLPAGVDAKYVGEGAMLWPSVPRARCWKWAEAQASSTKPPQKMGSGKRCLLFMRCCLACCTAWYDCKWTLAPVS